MNQEKVIEKIQQSDFYRGLIEQEKAELVEKRKAAAEALATIDGETEKKIRGIIKTISEAEKVAAEAEKAHQEARARVDALRAERAGAGAGAERQKRAHHAFLFDTADNRIDQAVQWFRDRFDELRRGTAIQQRHRGKFDLLHLTREISTVSNHQARVAALAYCRSAIETLQGMKLQAEVDQEALQALAKGLPNPEMAFTETTGRKPEKDISDVPYWARFKSDDLHELEMDHLMKKADSLKRKRA